MTSSGLRLFLPLLVFSTGLFASEPRFVMGSLFIKLYSHPLETPENSAAAAALQRVETALSRYGARVPVALWRKEFGDVIARRSMPVSTADQTYSLTWSLQLQRAASSISRIYKVHYASPADPRTVAAEVARLPGVEYAEPEPVYELLASAEVGQKAATPTMIPNDPLYGSYLTYQNFPAAWDITTGDSTVIIGMVDTGVQYTHPDLAAKLWLNSGEMGVDLQGRDKRTNGIDDDGNGYIDDWRGWNFENGTNDPMGTDSDHGTGTSSMAAGHTNNGIGISGSGFNCRYMVIKGTYIEAILYAAVNGAAVANCSFGSSFYSRTMNDIVEFATNVGTLVVCAAGNSNDDTPLYPAAYSSALSVASVDYAGSGTPNVKSGFSTYGYSVDVLATGNNINGCNFGGYFTGGSGTSFSAPIVAGLVGLIKSVHPDWSARRIGTQIRATAISIDSYNLPFYAGKLGHGRIDALAALTRTLPGVTVRSLAYSPGAGKVAAHILNYGSPTQNVQFSLTASSSDLHVLTPPVSAGVLGTGDSLDVSFDVSINSSIDYATRPTVRLNINDAGTGFDDFPILEFFPWTTQASFPLLDLQDICGVNRSVAWAVSSQRSVLRTTDRGLSWTSVASMLSSLIPSSIAAIDERTAFIAAGSGTGITSILRTTDGGMTWTTVYSGYSATCTGLRFLDRHHGAALMTSGSTDSSTFLSTADGGLKWDMTFVPPSSSGNLYTSSNSLVLIDTLHAWFSGPDSGRVYRTSDGGKHWSESRTGNILIVQTAFVSSALGVAASFANQPYLSRTFDGGQHWLTVNDASYPGLSAVVGVPGTTQIWAAGAGDFMQVSADGGMTWERERTPALGLIGGLTAIRDGDSCHIWGFSTSGDIFHRSVPALTNSIPAYLTFDARSLDLGYISKSLPSRDTLFYASNSGGAGDSVTVTLDNINLPTDSAVALSPSSFALGPGETTPIAVRIFPPFLQVGVVYNFGILLTSTSTTGPNPIEKAIIFSVSASPNGVSIGNSMPAITLLLQNFPNPFNPQTEIQYQLSRAGAVAITVFDILGRELAPIVNEVKTAGYHTSIFSGTGLPSGVYFCRMQADGYVGIRRMLLLK